MNKELLKQVLTNDDNPFVLLPPTVRKDITDKLKKLDIWEWTPTHLHLRFEGEVDIYLAIMGRSAGL